jgi:hypothetical protein
METTDQGEASCRALDHHRFEEFSAEVAAIRAALPWRLEQGICRRGASCGIRLQ